MIRAIRDLWNGHSGSVILVLAAVFAVLQITIPDETMIDVTNAMALSVSAGVIVTYAADGWTGACERIATKGGLLATGILLSWTAALLSALVSIGSRNFGMTWLLHSDFVSTFKFLYVAGGIMHMNAPKIIDDTIPRPQWRRLGMIAAVALFIALTITMRRPGLLLM